MASAQNVLDRPLDDFLPPHLGFAAHSGERRPRCPNGSGKFFEEIAPEDSARYVHKTEGLDDMPAHIRTALSQTQLAIPVASGRIVLGTWQGIYLFEHRRAPHRREIVLHLLGE